MFLATARQIAEEVSNNTGDAWKAIEAPNDAAWLERADGMRIWIGKSWSAKDRLSIHHSYPKKLDGNDPYIAPGERPSITVSLDKTPDKVARDISGRFLKEYGPLWQEVMKRVTEGNAYLTRAKEMAEEIAAGLGVQVKIPYHNRHNDYPGEYLIDPNIKGVRSLKVSGSSISFEFTTNDVAVARIALNTLHSLTKDKDD